MSKQLKPLVLINILLLTSCSFNDSNTKSILCENYFFLVNDFNHMFPDQDDYMLFLKNGYYETFYYKKENGFNCHYHLEYVDGTMLDEWGYYYIGGDKFYMFYETIGEKNPVFTKYASPTIDFHIIDTIEYGGKDYKIVYQARYLYSAKG